jgi:ATP-binding protein involved in chromosome partitioning
MPPDQPTPQTPAVPDRDQVLAALSHVRDPKSGKSLVEAGLVQGVAVGPGRAGFMLEVAAADVALYTPVSEAAETALLNVPGVERAQVVLTTQDAPGAPSDAYRVEARARPREAAPAPAAAALGGGHGHGHPHKPAPRPQPVPFVKKVVAVASGKGGVGKSTVAVNLAVALARRGLKVGLMDADIYGPSVPRMLGLNQQPRLTEDKKMIPLEAYGLHAVSIGFIVEEGSPMIWRGPMASSAITQFITDVRWGGPGEELDVLVVDMPPGTGDIQLTMAQKVKVDGAVIVSTPQEVALIDVRRGAGMFRKTDVPIFGVVENMAYFPDPTTGAPIAIFGRGGARAVAEELGAPFLGEVRIEVALREACDAGRPLVDADPDGEVGQVFAAMAGKVAAALGV